MTVFHSIILGITEGLTEFLPVSSTAHLILASHVLKLPPTEFLKSFEIAIQTGAIAAVLVMYWRKLLLERAVMLRVLIAFLPTAIIGFALHNIVKLYLLESVPAVLWSLLIGGVILVLFDLYHRERDAHVSDVAKITYMQAFWIGIFQSVAIVPGVSRAGATIVGGQLIGIKRAAIVDFTFLLAIPTMLAATGLDLVKTGGSFSQSDFLMLIVGTVTSFVVALLAIRWFLSYIRKHSFLSFGIYRIVIGIAGLLLLLR